MWIGGFQLSAELYAVDRKLNVSQSRQVYHGNDLCKLYTRFNVTLTEIETNKMWLKTHTKKNNK